MSADLARSEADERRLGEIDAGLDIIIATAVAARRELRYGDREALRGALATLKLLSNEIAAAFLALSDPGAPS